MRRTALKGHALRDEGKPYERGEYGGKWIRVSYSQFPTSPAGVGLCECGAVSPVLTSNGARRRWHAEVHKPEVRQLLAEASTAEPVAVTFTVTLTMTAGQRERYSAGIGVEGTLPDVLGRVRPEVLEAVKDIGWIGQYASVSISRPEAAVITEEEGGNDG